MFTKWTNPVAGQSTQNSCIRGSRHVSHRLEGTSCWGYVRQWNVELIDFCLCHSLPNEKKKEGEES